MAAKTFATKGPLSERMRSIQRDLWVVLALNLFVAAAKYLYGVFSGSESMQADGIHSVFDSAGNVVGLVGIALAARPADAGHPYGHTKFETYASLFIGVLLLLAAFEVGTSAVDKLISGTYTAEVGFFSFVVMGTTLLINLGVTTYEHRAAKRLKSEVLAADAKHTLSDALVSVGVIVGLAAVALGFPMADPIMALIVTIAILATAADVFKRAHATLSDRTRIPEDELQAAVVAVSGVQGVHCIRTRGTEGEVYADLHVLVSPDMTVRAAHTLSERVEGSIKERFPNVTDVLVHIEPNDGHED
ncbi:cation diffusion facilitator family transporter [Eggerthella sp. YY7918]|uniref:cation diffusion facilitator family transporter n=1 Tax=Eggerthella sp. (strain YY7918) TaxID=502558 RepID=UPI0002171686|nr:cation diffusion facilitator family transporter [Eggerthella sp. YY7918]BAK44452.1 hypothetical protein EGYY_12960 [Eggerthella sp. YY7918]